MIHFLKKTVKILTHRAFLIPLMMLAQIAIILIILLRFRQYLLPFYILCLLISIITTVHIINGKSNPGYKIAWIVPIMGMPVFGVLIYSIFGGNSLGKKEKEKLKKLYNKEKEHLGKKDLNLEEIRYENESAYTQAKYIHSYSLSTVSKHTKTTYYPEGKIYYNRLLEELKKAKKYIFIESYIIAKGKMLNTILTILKQKIEQGVEVRIIYDDFGCLTTLPNKYEEKLNKIGIKTVIFGKLGPNLRSKFNNRDHRKIVVIDGYTSFTGGINIADEYINEKRRFGYWKDNGIMLEGGATWNLAIKFLSMWDFITETESNYEKYEPSHDLVYNTQTDGYVIPYTDSPWDNEAVGENVYLNLINKANRYIYITTPYLILDNEMITALTNAAKRGVDVNIITPGIPDKKIVNEVTKAYYEELLESGIKIYEYKKGFIHTKTFIIDDIYATIGTINLDYRSLYLNFECGIWLYSCHTIQNIKADFLKTIKESRKIDKIIYKTKMHRLKVQFLKVFAPLM